MSEVDIGYLFRRYRGLIHGNSAQQAGANRADFGFTLHLQAKHIFYVKDINNPLTEG